MWNLKYDTNESIYKTEIDSDTENKLMVTKGEGGWGGGRDKLGGWEYHIHTTMYKIDKQKRTYCIAQGTILNFM